MCRSLGAVNLWYHDRQSSTEKNRGWGTCDKEREGERDG